jgi:dihydroorotate dehydrogenase (fumarate)
VDLVQAVKKEVGIPVAVKLGPYFSSMAHMAARLDAAGADGLVLFNRFYQPDYDLESLEVVPNLTLSSSHELLLRLHWIAVLYGTVKADLALTGGVHGATDVIKSMMAGAKIAMMTSALLKRGISYLDTIANELLVWMSEHEYDSIVELRNYLRNALICVDQVEMFACQTGAEAEDTQHAQISSPEGIALAEFYFKDGQYVIIRTGKDSQRVTEAEKCLQRVTRPVSRTVTDTLCVDIGGSKPLCETAAASLQPGGNREKVGVAAQTGELRAERVRRARAGASTGLRVARHPLDRIAHLVDVAGAEIVAGVRSGERRD